MLTLALREARRQQTGLAPFGVGRVFKPTRTRAANVGTATNTTSERGFWGEGESTVLGVILPLLPASYHKELNELATRGDQVTASMQEELNSEHLRQHTQLALDCGVAHTTMSAQ